MSKTKAQPHQPPKEAVETAEGQEFYESLADGQIYSLQVTEPDTYGRTHRATSATHTWVGNRAEFKLAFERVS